jgi:hypothetical protein
MRGFRSCDDALRRSPGPSHGLGGPPFRRPGGRPLSHSSRPADHALEPHRRTGHRHDQDVRVIAELTGEGRRRPELRVLGVGQARTSGVRREVVTHIEETTESISQRREGGGAHGRRIGRSGLGGDQRGPRRPCSSMGVVAVGGEEISRSDLDRVHEVARAVALPPDREFLHAIPQEYTGGSPAGNQGSRGHVGTSGSRPTSTWSREHASASTNLRKAVTRAGYRVQALVLSPLATARAVLTEDEKEVGVAMVESALRPRRFAAYYEGRSGTSRCSRSGATRHQRPRPKGLSIPFAEAQRAKERARRRLRAARRSAGDGGTARARRRDRSGRWLASSSPTSSSSASTRSSAWSRTELEKRGCWTSSAPESS